MSLRERAHAVSENALARVHVCCHRSQERGHLQSRRSVPGHRLVLHRGLVLTCPARTPPEACSLNGWSSKASLQISRQRNSNMCWACMFGQNLSWLCPPTSLECKTKAKSSSLHHQRTGRAGSGAVKHWSRASARGCYASAPWAIFGPRDVRTALAGARRLSGALAVTQRGARFVVLCRVWLTLLYVLMCDQ